MSYTVLERQEVSDNAVYVPEDPTMGQWEIAGQFIGAAGNIATGFIQSSVQKKQISAEKTIQLAQTQAQKDVAMYGAQAKYGIYRSVIPWIGVFALAALVVLAKRGK